MRCTWVPKHSAAVIVGLTVAFQLTNFVFDWKALRFFPTVTWSETVDAGDNAHYFGLARNLLMGQGYVAPVDELPARLGQPTYVRTPGQPMLFVVPLLLFAADSGYEITDANRPAIWWFVYAIYLAAWCVGAVCFFKLCLYLTGRPGLSFVAGLVYIVWPSNLVYLSPYMGAFADTLVSPLLLWVTWRLLTGAHQRAAKTVMVGSVLGWCILSRVYLMPMTILCLAVALLTRAGVTRRRMAWTAIIAALVVAPWIVRNYVVFDDVSLSSQGGRHFWLGNNPSARGSYDGMQWYIGSRDPDKFPLLKSMADKYPGLFELDYSEKESSRTFRNEAVEWILSEPRWYLWLLARKLAVTFYPGNYEQPLDVNMLTAVVFVLFVPGFVLYVVDAYRRRVPAESLILLGPMICAMVTILTFYAEHRVRFVLEPYMILFAAYGIHRATTRLGASTQVAPMTPPLSRAPPR